MSIVKMELKGFEDVQKGLMGIDRKIKRNLNLAIKKSTLVAINNIKSETPVKTGKLKKSIKASFKPLMSIIEPHNVKYAGFVHDGTSPYTIRPRSKKALYWQGAKHPVKSVRHPGIKANPFMEKGGLKSITEIRKIFLLQMDKIVKISINKT